MRSTRAAAAIARLNERSTERHYQMVVLGNGLFELRERIDGLSTPVGEPLALDAFVRFVDAQGPQKVARVTRSDAAFARQLQRSGKP